MTLKELELIAQEKETRDAKAFLKALAEYWTERKETMTVMHYKRCLALMEKHRKDLYVILDQRLEAILVYRSKNPLSYL
ncbi:MAG: hypothetical protein COT25_02155 [Candidatus Kerfeldbacteria bacterium CG08_land_8_20_14_0_20_42_7]|uniref:Uncharacterized protein n=1 Tax=Candidatus Kerfeldbacteria bacterium CG08_land_8_20_14_0_20_42_7 TaxID=2014245 RepID=A0A2H0YSX9_9BACT|nr:MAG: hypothetical protein COT25_02155 [Candidatus Kerfeldbacteria bacterium CG08_land_8_20_14_0_20_42_7]